MHSIEQRRNNPLNNSSSKQLFSFPKSHRFVHHNPTESPDAFYRPQAHDTQLTFTFAKSHRLKTDSQKDTTQFFYNIEGEIQKALKKKAGVRILYGREDCKSKGVFQISETPGPGNYNPNPQAFKPRIASECSIGHDLRVKTIKEDPLPGPGAYRIFSTLLNEEKVLSKYTKRSYGRMIFQESKPTRVITEPAPKINFPQINCKGDKTFQQGRGFMIGKSQRFPKRDNSVQPGPGSYKIFTQFADVAR